MDAADVTWPPAGSTCFMAGSETPCWGKLQIFSDNDQGGMWVVTACEGHLPIYDGAPYKPQPAGTPAGTDAKA